MNWNQRRTPGGETGGSDLDLTESVDRELSLRGMK